MQPTIQTCNRRKTHQDRRGAVLVEFAVVAPLFFLILFTMIEFSHLVTIRNAAHNAVYEGARLIVVPGATPEEGEEEVTRIMNIIGVHHFDVNVTPREIDENTQSVNVELTIPYSANAIFVPRFANDITVRSQVKMKTERFGGTYRRRSNRRR